MTRSAGRDLDRVRWRCRRGLLELDLLLSRFVERHLLDLAAEERMAFEALLELPDPDLWDLLAGVHTPSPGAAERVVSLLREP